MRIPYIIAALSLWLLFFLTNTGIQKLFPDMDLVLYYECLGLTVFVVIAIILHRKSSRRKKTENELIFENRKFRAILDELPDPVVVMDANFKVQWANVVAENFAPNIQGLACFDGYRKRTQPCDDCPCVLAKESGKAEQAVVYHECTVGIDRPSFFDMTCVPVKDDNGKVKFLIKVAKDITDSKKEMEALMIFNEILNDFISNDGMDAFRKALNVILDYMKSPYGIFGYCEDDTLVCAAMTDVYSECRVEQGQAKIPHDKWGGAWGLAMQSKQAVMKVTDSEVPDGHIPIKQTISAPILYKDCTIGVITVANAQREYTEHDAEKLQNVADKIAAILFCKLQFMSLEN